MNVFENDVVEFDGRRWLFPVAGSGFVVSEVKFNFMVVLYMLFVCISFTRVRRQTRVACSFWETELKSLNCITLSLK